MDAQENAEKIIMAKLKMLEKQATKFENQVNDVLKEIATIDKENKALIAKGDADSLKKVEDNKVKIKELHQKIKQINKEKEAAIGCELNLGFRDDSNLRPKVDI